MQIQKIQNNYNQNFRALHADRNALKELNCRTADILNNRSIKECADKYEVLLKRKKINITKPYDKFITAVWASVSSVIGGGIGLISITGAGAEAAFLPVLAARRSPPALFLLGTYLYHNKPSYQYSIQAGKKISDNQFGKHVLGGTLSREFIVADKRDIRDVHSLGEDIEKNDYDKFLDLLDNYHSDDVISILKDKKIKEEFKDGEHFNFSVDADDNTLLTKFFDIIPTEENQKDYNKILDSMKDMKKINFNQKDSFGISVLEKILNAENRKALNLVKDFEFEYSPELDSAYENISDENFKLSVKDLKIKFTHAIDAVRIDSAKALKIAIKEFDSPLCDKNKEVKNLLDFYHSNTRRYGASAGVMQVMEVFEENERL